MNVGVSRTRMESPLAGPSSFFIAAMSIEQYASHRLPFNTILRLTFHLFYRCFSFESGLTRQFAAAFDQNARGSLQSVISWIPDGLLPGSELKDAEREALFAEFVKFKQDIVAGLLNSIYKVAHTTSTVSHQSAQDCVALATVCSLY